MQPLTGFRDQTATLSRRKTRVAAVTLLKSIQTVPTACGEGQGGRLGELLFQKLMEPLLAPLNIRAIPIHLKGESLLQRTQPAAEMLQLQLC